MPSTEIPPPLPPPGTFVEPWALFLWKIAAALGAFAVFLFSIAPELPDTTAGSPRSLVVGAAGALTAAATAIVASVQHYRHTRT